MGFIGMYPILMENVQVSFKAYLQSPSLFKGLGFRGCADVFWVALKS